MGKKGRPINMMRQCIKMFVMGLLALTCGATVAISEQRAFELPGFGSHKFELTDTSPPKSFAMVPDPIDASNKGNVFRFATTPAHCYRDDCEQQSVRSTLSQDSHTFQPNEAWYGWELYFPKDFPINGEQAHGKQIFNEWKDQTKCKLVGLALFNDLGGNELFWDFSKPTGKANNKGGNECSSILKAPVAKMSNFLGAWHRFEFFARWSEKSDGRFLVYLDGKLKVDFSGVTCFNCRAMNYAMIGNYLCCTPDTKNTQPSVVYYRYVSRAKTREELQWQ